MKLFNVEFELNNGSFLRDEVQSIPRTTGYQVL